MDEKVWGKLKHGRKWNMGIWCLNKFNEMDLWDKSERESYLDKCHWSRLEASTTSWDWQSLQRLLFKWSKPLTSISDGAQVRILFLFFIKFLERITRKDKAFLLYISYKWNKENLRFSLTVSKCIICWWEKTQWLLIMAFTSF